MKKTFVQPQCQCSRSAWLLVTIIGLTACHQVAPELSAGAENWQMYRSPQYGFEVSYPPKLAIQLHHGERDVLLRLEDYPVVAINVSSNAEAKQRGLWARHEPVGTETVDGRVALKYEYLHCDGFFCMATVSLVVPYREAYLAVEFRTDNKVLDDTQRRILDSVRIND